MNGLSEIDQALLKNIKKKIELLSGVHGGDHLSQKDLEFLVFYIQDKTGQALSFTTIKRIWRKEYQRLPHLSTLDLLSQMAFSQNWHDAKKQFVENREGDREAQINTPEIPPAIRPSASLSGKNRMKVIALCAALALGILLGVYVTGKFDSNTSNIKFSATATADLRIPNTVVFSYDVSDFNADRFYIQQSWDPARKVEISSNSNTQTDIYYEPGYHYAKLMGEEKVLKEIPVHIRYNDWYVRFRYPDSELVRVLPADLNTEGYMGLKPEYVKILKTNSRTKFQLGYMLSKDFNLPADAIQFEAAVKFDSALAPSCPEVNVLIKGDKDYAWITFGNVGCESNLSFKVGDTNVSGKLSDLSSMSMDVFSWQKVKVTITDGTFRFYVNAHIVYEGTYSNKLGALKEIDFFFNGIGSLDEIAIEDREHHPLLSQKF